MTTLRSFAVISLCISLTLAPASIFAHEADKYMSIVCNGSTEYAIEHCNKTRKEFQNLYQKSFKNDYQSQRNLAYMLWSGSGPVRQNKTTSCAWRMVIVAMASKHVDDTDHGNLEFYCGSISDSEKARAKIEAMSIGGRILSGGKIDATIQEPNPKLDGTAHPL